VLEDVRKTCPEYILAIKKSSIRTRCDGKEVTLCYARRRVTVFHMQITYISQSTIDLSAEIQHTIFLNQRITLIHIVCIIVVARDVVD
jgi:hypothetical protein